MTLHAAPEPGETPAPPAMPAVPDLNGFVELWFGGTLERRTSNTRRWCPRWDEHPEAVARLRVLHASWVQVAVSGDALTYSTWMLDHFDRHAAVLLSAEGPFAGCAAERHSPARPLPIAPAPKGPGR